MVVGAGHVGGTVAEHLSCLREAGFVGVDCFWKEYRLALAGGFKGVVRVPDERSR